MYVWTTGDEIEHIEKLGTWRQNASEKVEDVPRSVRVDLLKGYLQGTHLRANWGAINPIHVIERARALLRELGVESDLRIEPDADPQPTESL